MNKITLADSIIREYKFDLGLDYKLIKYCFSLNKVYYEYSVYSNPRWSSLINTPLDFNKTVLTIGGLNTLTIPGTALEFNAQNPQLSIDRFKKLQCLI